MEAAMERTEHPLVGKPLPDLQLADWRGEKTEPGRQPGKVVIIDFWATWCAPCIGYIPKNRRLLERYGHQDVVLIGICATTGSKDMDEVAKERGITYPIARDVDKWSERALHVRHFPEYFLIDRRGIVYAAGLRGSEVLKTLAALLDEQPAENVSED